MNQLTAHDNKKGIALLVAVLTIGAITTAGLALFNLGFREYTISSTLRDSQLAFYASEAGSECARYWSIKNRRFFDPKYENQASYSSITCNGTSISLDGVSGTDPVTGDPITIYNFGFDYGAEYPYSSDVTVTRMPGLRDIDINSSGYNTRVVTSPRKLERDQLINVYGLCTDRFDMMLTLDSSGSIQNENGDPVPAPGATTDEDRIRRAALTLVELLNPKPNTVNIGNINFSDEYHSNNGGRAALVQTLTSSLATLNTKIGEYEVRDHNGTNMDEAFVLAHRELTSVRDRSDSRYPDYVLIMTDGAPSGFVDDVSDNSLSIGCDETIDDFCHKRKSMLHAQASAEQLKNAGTEIVVVSVGIGEGDCPAFAAPDYTDGNKNCHDWLSKYVATDPSFYVPIDTFSELEETFRNMVRCVQVVDEE